jgi:hypothetical protein
MPSGRLTDIFRLFVYQRKTEPILRPLQLLARENVMFGMEPALGKLRHYAEIHVHNTITKDARTMTDLARFSETQNRRHLSPYLLILILALALCGCGSGDNDFVITGQPAGTAASGNVLVQHPLSGQLVSARQVQVGDDVAQSVMVGKNAAGQVIYGPVNEDRDGEHLLENVPVDVVEIESEYLEDDGDLHGTGEAAVQVVAGQTVIASMEVEKPLTIQIVNESEQPDDQVFVLLSANGEVDVDLQGGELAIYKIGVGSDTVVSSPLTSMAKVGTRVSSLSGKTVNVYEFLPTKVVSGRFWVSYGAPLTYAQGDTAPGNFENVRYDKIELGYDPGSGNPTGFFDLTSVDFFAIPLQLEVLADPSDTTALRTTTFYTSTDTLLRTLYNLSPSTMASSFYARGPETPAAGWSPESDTLNTFARAMSPSTLVSIPPATDGDPFSAAPYPSFRNYLASIANAGTVVELAGANGVDGGALTQWQYQASVVSDGDDGFIIKCQPGAAMSNTPQGSLGDPKYPQDPQLPPDLAVDIHMTPDQLDQFVYGVPANAFTIIGLDAYLTPYAANSVYANIGGNFLAGLNFGYVDGKFGDDGSHWYDLLPGYPPYGAAREDATDGYYNPWAAVLFNLSDSYSYSISDRLQVGNPLVTTSPSEPYLRVSILPDSRLDAPGNIKATAGDTADAVTVTWDAVDQPSGGFTLTGYKVTASDGSVQLYNPANPLPTTVQPNDISVTTTDTTANLTGLTPGTAYHIKVQAVGTFNGQSVTSSVGQFAAYATPLPPSPTSDLINFVVGLAPPPNLAPGIKFSVDGQEVSATQTVPVRRSVPTADGAIVRALFTTTAPDPSNPGGPDIVIGMTNVLLNVFPDATKTGFYNPYYNFPFSSSVPASGGAQARLLDGSLMNFAYNTSGAEPPFANAGSSLSVNVSPMPNNGPKTVASVSLPSTTPVAVQTPGPDIPPPSYQPPAHDPIVTPPFKVQAIILPGSSVQLSDLDGATVRFVRLVTYPTNSSTGVDVPGADGGGADAATQLDKNGVAIFDPNSSPYNAPIWNIGYRVDILIGTDTYSAYGSWRTPQVGPEWTSGLSGQPNEAGTIYVPVGPNPQGQSVWGN